MNVLWMRIEASPFGNLTSFSNANTVEHIFDQQKNGVDFSTESATP